MKADNYPDTSIDAVAPTLWLIRYPPYMRSIPRHMRPRYVVHNFVGVKWSQRRTTEIREVPDGFFDDMNKGGSCSLWCVLRMRGTPYLY